MAYSYFPLTNWFRRKRDRRNLMNTQCVVFRSSKLRYVNIDRRSTCTRRERTIDRVIFLRPRKNYSQYGASQTGNSIMFGYIPTIKSILTDRFSCLSRDLKYIRTKSVYYFRLKNRVFDENDIFIPIRFLFSDSNYGWVLIYILIRPTCSFVHERLRSISTFEIVDEFRNNATNVHLYGYLARAIRGVLLLLTFFSGWNGSVVEEGGYNLRDEFE